MKAGPSRSFVLSALCALAAGCGGPRPITNLSCTAPPEVEAASAATVDLWNDCGYSVPCWRAKIESARNLRDRYPEELLAHRALLYTVYRAPVSFPDGDAIKRDLRVEYEAAARRHPASAAYPLLLARLEDRRPAKVALVEEALKRDPEFGWAHQAWITHHARIPEAKKPDARAHAAAFARLCPNRPGELLDALEMLQDREAWAAAEPALRGAVTVESGRFADLPDLWEMEFRFAAPTDFDALRDRVRGELDALRRLDRRSDRAWLAALQKGYAITGDLPEAQAVEAMWLEDLPCSSDASQIWARRREAAPPRPRDPDPWLEACPDDVLLWQYKLHEKEAGPEQVALAADHLLPILGETIAGRVAERYLDAGVRLDRVAGLIERSGRRIERYFAMIDGAGLPEADVRQDRHFLGYEVFTNQALRVRLALAQRDRAQADLALATLEAEFEKLARTANASDKPTVLEARLWALRAQRQALDGDDAGALDGYRRALGKSPDDPEIVTAARAAYAKVHGAAGFDAWRDAAARAGRSLSEESTIAARRPLPELALSDLQGRPWTSAQLRGRAVLVNFWATWCGPCLQELPSIQALHRRLQSRKDVAVVTVNVDDNPGLVQPFLTKSKYTFPVFLGGPNSFQRLGLVGIPLSYIVDPGGTIVSEQMGFLGDSEAWMRRTEESLLAAAGRTGG